MKDRLSGLKILVQDNDIIIFNPEAGAWYYTTAEGLEVCKRCWRGETRELPEDREEREFLEDVEETLFLESAKRRKPRQRFHGATIYVTRNCNMQCRHCRGAGGIAEDDLNLSVAKDYIEAAFAEGTTSFTLTGGEPLTKWEKTKALIECIRSQKANVPIQLLTNGSLIDKEKAQALAELEVLAQVSLDTLNPATFLWFRGRPIEPVLRGLQTLVECGVKTAVSAVLTRCNSGDLPALIEFCARRGVFGIHFPFLEKGGRGSQHWESLALTDEEMIAALRVLMHMYFDGGLRGKLSFMDFESVMERIMYVPYSLTCKCGRETSALYPDGRIYFCTNLAGDERYCGGTMTRGILQRMRKLPQIVNLPTTSDVETCRDCEVNWVCLGGCKDRANLCYGTMFHPDPWCGVFKWWFREMAFITARLIEEGVL